MSRIESIQTGLYRSSNIVNSLLKLLKYKIFLLFFTKFTKEVVEWTGVTDDIIAVFVCYIK